MQLHELPEDQAFRAEVREFVAANLPTDIRDRVLDFQRVEREDYVRWQKILHARGWGAAGKAAASTLRVLWDIGVANVIVAREGDGGEQGGARAAQRVLGHLEARR